MRKRIRRHLVKLRSRLGTGEKSRRATAQMTAPGELLSLEQLQQRARKLAGQHGRLQTGGREKLRARLLDNEGALLLAHETLARTLRQQQRLVPAEEWLVDNFYLVEEQILTIKKHFPRKYSQQIPQLADGALAGYPRVYALVQDLLAWIDNRVDDLNLGGFVNAYQDVAPLTIGELWAIPIVLRLALVENTRHVAARVARSRQDRNAAAFWADRAIDTAEKDPRNLVLMAADMARANLELTSSFVAEFARRLHGQSPKLVFLINWIEQRLNENGLGIEQQMHRETHLQTISQASIANNITSFRFLEATDWQEFVESVSPVENLLRDDPVDVYNHSDFATRDHCRDEVERFARRSGRTETGVAETVLRLAREHAGAGTDDKRAHVGYYLLGAGRERLAEALGVGGARRRKVSRLLGNGMLGFYLGFVFLLTALLTVFVLEYARLSGLDGLLLKATGLALFLAFSQLSVTVAGWLFMGFSPPVVLPRMDFSRRVPPEAKTLVVIPCLLTSPQGIRRLLENLELGFLANPGENIYWALLTDFCDASAEHMPADEAHLELLSGGITALNEKYSDGDRRPFALFHRPRRWNPRERSWMGDERKRGKLEALNGFLQGGGTGLFSLAIGAESMPRDIRYVLTLDADTRLPRDAVQELAATMSHPLNRPEYDPKKGRVVAGYGVLQPRLATSLDSVRRSRYAHYFSGEPGLDPYTRLVSDLYQDLFREGSFLGKGIYDLDTFRRVLDGRFPDNLVLSHDLLESCHIRSGLVSDIILYEDFPASYRLDLKRRHRWVRGDWQIAGWLLPRVPGPGGWTRNSVSLLGRWKILDNLRRSLVPVALLAVLALGWTAGPDGWLWSVTVAAAVLSFPLLSGLLGLLRKDSEVPWPFHLKSVREKTLPYLVQSAWMLAALPVEAAMAVDAVARTIWRLCVTRRGLLQWQSFRETVEKNRVRNVRDGGDLLPWAAPAVAVALAVYLAGRVGGGALVPALIFLALWLGVPFLAWFLAHPVPKKKFRWSDVQRAELRKLALKYWVFFENFVDAGHNWLPPDNYQEKPVAMVASRTSPTNIGLYLLSNLAACDFGYQAPGACLERVARAFQSMGKMERFQGHFFNWYDTVTLEPLNPRYISTVDSGNLVGHLAVLREGLAELPGRPILPGQVFDGLGDTVSAFMDYAAGSPAGGADGPASSPETLLPTEMLEKLALFAAWLKNPPELLAERCRLVRELADLAEVAHARAMAFDQREVEWWGRVLLRQCRSVLDDLETLTPWFFPRPGKPAPAGGISESEPESGWAKELDGVFRCGAGLTLLDIVDWQRRLAPDLVRCPENDGAAPGTSELVRLRRNLEQAAAAAARRLELVEQLVNQCRIFAEAEYDFLYDRSRKLLVTGYHVSERRKDSGFYDLLASEARLGSFVAVAEGRLPRKHWFSLGRLLVGPGAKPALVSWSGSMFEYLMPNLVMPVFEETLLSETAEAAVDYQVKYGRSRGVPWGFSESCYNALGTNRDYQYTAFGVPGLGLKRGLADDLVVAPYASLMAMMVAPQEAWRNIELMRASGFEGYYGLYEAVDYTPARLPRGEKFAVVRAFLTHHQGMSLLSLAHTLLDRPMQRRFRANPAFRATELLLQEKISQLRFFTPKAVESPIVSRDREEHRDFVRVFNTPDTRVPQVHLLSNGRYTMVITGSGAGYSKWRDVALTRWSEDATRDDAGLFVYLRDVGGAGYWSVGHQPTVGCPQRYEAVFSQSRAELRRYDGDFITHTEIAVSSEEDVEVRRVNITNRAGEARVVELTTYAELALIPLADYLTHPAFNNLFVQVEPVDGYAALIATRRPRSAGEKTCWAFHLFTTRDGFEGGTSHENDRLRFLGRCGRAARPAAMDRRGDLAGDGGPTTDPIFALRGRISVPAGETRSAYVVTGVSKTRQAALELVARYQGAHVAARAFDLAWTHSQVLLRQLDISEAEAQLYGRLASSIIYSDPLRRARPVVLAASRGTQADLWRYGISGDYPVVLLRVENLSSVELVKQLIRAHAYWRLKGLAVELVIWNEEATGYRQLLQDHLAGSVSTGTEAQQLNVPGGIFIIKLEQMREEDRILMQAVARLIFSDQAGSMVDQTEHKTKAVSPAPKLKPSLRPRPAVRPPAPPVPGELRFDNGQGGFSPDGREYVIRVTPGNPTPAPWVNVLANPDFGAVVSESGSAYTWRDNAHEYRLTPWYNDPVTDRCGEAFYLRDEESGRFWSPTPQPAPGDHGYICRHGFGYSVFETTASGIGSVLKTFVDIQAPVRFVVLEIRNRDARPRRVSVTGFVEWTLGQLRGQNARYVLSRVDARTGALFAVNSYHPEFSRYTAFFDVNDGERVVSGDRDEFIGRNRDLGRPAAMENARLSGRVGAGLDPCGALQSTIDLAPGEQRELVFLLGAGRDQEEARELVQRFRKPGAAADALAGVRAYWQRMLGSVSVVTANPEIDLLVNGWLVYQALAGRIMARTGYYQSSGAFGFRDQLQDALALVHAEPGVLRAQIKTCAEHQFRDGDVQHWWHPPFNRGVRTRVSDDMLWLPFAVCRYLETTGDWALLDDPAAFLEGRHLRDDEQEYYDLPAQSAEEAGIYEHCVRAVNRALRFGPHGLPLIGGGDWNDGMDLVGARGSGESVWLAFFLCHVLDRFAGVAERRGDQDFAGKCRREREKLSRAVAEHGWDGAWFRRAYFDDGRPLGSAENSECEIDLLVQAWAVLSGAADPGRALNAMESARRKLVDYRHRLVKLLKPPFDKSDLEPGYIKGYLPGTRENGGQYTQAAVWFVMAWAKLGRHEQAWKLLALLNPVNHGSTAADIAVYRAEPYVTAGDVCALEPLAGRAGWSWYTGSAGWMYQLLLEWIIGLRREGDRLAFVPCWPGHWRSPEISYRYGRATYRILVRRKAGAGLSVDKVTVDGLEQAEPTVLLADQPGERRVEVFLA